MVCPFSAGEADTVTTFSTYYSDFDINVLLIAVYFVPLRNENQPNAVQDLNMFATDTPLFSNYSKTPFSTPV